METITLGERTAYMLFGTDGKAFTNGYIELPNEETGHPDYYYFLTNGQAFTTGYKTVKIDDVTYYFFFEENGKAFTGGFKDVPFGESSFTYYFQADGKAHANGWQTIGETDYYFQANGRVAKDTIVTIDDKLYYIDENFVMAKGGWHCMESAEAYCYADENGVLSADTVIEGYKLNKEGKCPTKFKIIKYVNKYTDETMTDQQKIKALYDWVLGNSMVYIRNNEHTKSSWKWKDSWVDDMAASQIANWGGNCYRYAAFLGMLIREATDLPVKVYRGQTPGAVVPLTPHSWVSVYQNGTWYNYDVELDKHSNYATSSCYKISPSKNVLHYNGTGTKLYTETEQ